MNFETYLYKKEIDWSAIIEKAGIVKIRNLDRSIADSLKNAYGFRCQICGLLVGERYNTAVIHAHHIEYFSLSMNNNIDNILIICPNHHGIIHATNPEFDKTSKAFTYPNGYTEGLKINIHL